MWVKATVQGCLLLSKSCYTGMYTFADIGETPWVKHTHALWSYKARPQQGVGVGIMLVSKERIKRLNTWVALEVVGVNLPLVYGPLAFLRTVVSVWRGCLCLMSRGWGKLALGAQPSTNSEKLCKISPFWDNFSQCPSLPKIRQDGESPVCSRLLIDWLCSSLDLKFKQRTGGTGIDSMYQPKEGIINYRSSLCIICTCLPAALFH